MSKLFHGLVTLLLAAPPVLAQDAAPPAATGPVPDLQTAEGLFMFDYQTLKLETGGQIDLFGVQYLQRFSDWLYWGGGISAPLAQGNYGGFFTASATLHAQTSLGGNWIADAGISLGAGAGGSSVQNIKELSGSGLYLKEYLGLGYVSGGLTFGVNYVQVGIEGSPIGDGTFGVFVQKPLSYLVGAYADAGRRVGPAPEVRMDENVISFAYNTVSQIDPQGSYKGNIGLVSAQVSHFFSANDYVFLSLDLGSSGLIWYNQVQGGLGHRFTLSPKVSLSGQLGVGSGGWVTDTIDTGPGLIVYAQALAEYRITPALGAFLSAGYLAAPLGTSRSWSVGAGLSYHIGAGHRPGAATPADQDLALRGVRISLFPRRAFDVVYNGNPIDDLNIATLQVDYAFAEHWYIPVQIGAATTDFIGFAGYVEGLAGIGWQSRPFAGGRMQGFVQALYGLSDVGIDAEHDVGALLNGAIGVNYRLNDQYALYAQVGRTISLGQYTRENFDNNFSDTSIGLGLTYRFSLPIWVRG